MSQPGSGTRATPTIAGIAPGLVGPVISILESSSIPLRRRKLLEELGRHGHRISLAGLNRILQQCAQSGLTTEGADGVRLTRRPLASPTGVGEDPEPGDPHQSRVLR